jgi:hypothetical protein
MAGDAEAGGKGLDPPLVGIPAEPYPAESFIHDLEQDVFRGRRKVLNPPGVTWIGTSPLFQIGAGGNYRARAGAHFRVGTHIRNGFEVFPFGNNQKFPGPPVLQNPPEGCVQLSQLPRASAKNYGQNGVQKSLAWSLLCI